MFLVHPWQSCSVGEGGRWEREVEKVQGWGVPEVSIGPSYDLVAIAVSIKCCCSIEKTQLHYHDLCDRSGSHVFCQPFFSLRDQLWSDFGNGGLCEPLLCHRPSIAL